MGRENTEENVSRNCSKSAGWEPFESLDVGEIR